MSPVAARFGPFSVVLTGGKQLTFTPQFAYVANISSNNVSAFTINASTGALTTVKVGKSPVEALRDEDGVFEVSSPYGHVFQGYLPPRGKDGRSRDL